MPTVAVTVAGGALRITMLKGHDVTYWQNVPLAPGLVRDGWIADPEQFASALRDVFATCNLPKRRVAFAVPGHLATGQLLNIDLAGATDPNALIAHEAYVQLDVAPDQHYLFWQAVDQFPAGKVFVLAVQKDAVDGMVRACAIARIRPVTADLRPLALARAVAQPDAIVADVESTSIDILILNRGLPLTMRSLHLADAPLARESVHTRLVAELCTAIRLHDETNPEAPLDLATPVCLTGDLADSDLAQRIASITKHHTVQPEPPFSCLAGFPVARYMVNVGLLLKQV
jgi:Tfp pilus assembly PilM family ATPase